MSIYNAEKTDTYIKRKSFQEDTFFFQTRLYLTNTNFPNVQYKLRIIEIIWNFKLFIIFLGGFSANFRFSLN